MIYPGKEEGRQNSHAAATAVAAAVAAVAAVVRQILNVRLSARAICHSNGNACCEFKRFFFIKKIFGNEHYLPH